MSNCKAFFAQTCMQLKALDRCAQLLIANIFSLALGKLSPYIGHSAACACLFVALGKPGPNINYYVSNDLTLTVNYVLRSTLMPKVKVTVEKLKRLQMDRQTDRRYQMYYLPAKRCSAVDKNLHLKMIKNTN